MFRRELRGQVHDFDVAGLWGSGNVVNERSLGWSGKESGYRMWDGLPLWGPARETGVVLEKFPVLTSVLPLSEFLDRYEGVTECQVWLGDEVLGERCDEVCAHLSAVCDAADEAECLADCATYPKALSDCLLNEVDDCRTEAVCGLGRWEDDHGVGSGS